MRFLPKAVLIIYLLATALCVAHSVYRWPGSYNAEASMHFINEVLLPEKLSSDGRVVVLNKPGMALLHNVMMGVIIDDPWTQRYRWEAFKTMARAASFGYVLSSDAAEALYSLSRRTGGNSPDILVARYSYLKNVGGSLITIKRIEERFVTRMPLLLEKLLKEG